MAAGWLVNTSPLKIKPSRLNCADPKLVTVKAPAKFGGTVISSSMNFDTFDCAGTVSVAVAIVWPAEVTSAS